MTSLADQLADPVLRQAEIDRLTAEYEQSRKDRRYLDAQAYKGALQLYTDARDGIERCYGCGRIKGRVRVGGTK